MPGAGSIQIPTAIQADPYQTEMLEARELACFSGYLVCLVCLVEQHKPDEPVSLDDPSGSLGAIDEITRSPW